jgi:hypothetical protein
MAGRMTNKIFKLLPFSIVVLILTISVLSFLTYSQKRFVIYNNTYIIEKDSCSSGLKTEEPYFHVTSVDPVAQSINNCNLSRYLTAGNDTMYDFRIGSNCGLVSFDISNFDNLDLSKTILKKVHSNLSPRFRVQSGFFSRENGVELSYRIPKNNFNKLTIKIPKSAITKNVYQCQSSIIYLIATKNLRIDFYGNRNGNIYFSGKNNNDELLVAFNRKQNGKLNISLGFSIKGEKLDTNLLLDLIKCIAK